MTEPYQGYAAVYDALGQGQWGATLARFALDVVLPGRGGRPRAALDLACGTGAAALVLARAGIRTVGVDRSAAMLRAARRKARDAGLALPLVRADLRAFAVARPFDLVLCCYDSLNYLTDPRDLVAALGCARGALAEGGLFVCDLTTRHAYTGELDGIAHEIDLGDLHYRWQTTWDEATTLAATTIRVRTFSNERDGLTVERHIQRPYAPVEVAQALHAAGLHLLVTYAAEGDGPPLPSPAKPDSPRVVYVATRPD